MEKGGNSVTSVIVEMGWAIKSWNIKTNNFYMKIYTENTWNVDLISVFFTIFSQFFLNCRPLYLK